MPDFLITKSLDPGEPSGYEDTNCGMPGTVLCRELYSDHLFRCTREKQINQRQRYQISYRLYHCLLNFLFCLLKQNANLISCSKNEQQIVLEGSNFPKTSSLQNFGQVGEMKSFLSGLYQLPVRAFPSFEGKCFIQGLSAHLKIAQC